MITTPIGRLRVVSILEGISYLVLLGIAMPLKYLAGLPEVVRVVGSLHGILTILFVAAVAHVWLARRWSLGRVIGALVASVIPFGAFVLDAHLRREQRMISEPTTAIPLVKSRRDEPRPARLDS